MSASINSYSTGSYFGVTSDFFNASSKTSSSTSYLSDYSNIKSGSYYKLMKAYYKGDKTAASLVGSSAKSTTTAADKINAISVRDESSALGKSASKLLATGTDSLFQKTAVKDDEGNETQEYDTDKIYKSVSSFVDNYNDLIKSAADSSSSPVLSSTASMVGSTKSNETLLSSIGITVGSDNTLSIDKTEFKNAETSTIKSLFNGAGSYGYRVATKSANIYNQSVSQLAQLTAGTSYSSSGSYSYNYTGSLYNSLL